MAKWVIDPDHAVAEFTVYHMMVTPVHGQFNSVKGSINFDPADPGSMSVDVEIEAAGLYTGVERRDNHLRSVDFFDVANFPVITFKSAAIKIIALNNIIITGDLTIHGITRSVVFRTHFIGPSKFYDDELKQTYTTFGFRATASIDREDFGITWNVGIEDGGFMVGKTIDLVFNAEIDLEE
ncbi:MAG: YceI family protein [Syntrophorhabdaceae bacterium]|nr:YceI family protein [Syntrophorhabdaceae bacterium]MDD4196219.1 YceI family protein [Syntrophorhabdaceae bacterium]HOC46880.1 YceI family protein [Syntrophorhabdaceae bacterium]